MENIFMIDTHAHLYLEDYDSDLAAVMERMRAAGVNQVYMPSLKAEYVQKMLDLELAYPGICMPMIGVHPAYVKEDIAEELRMMKEWMSKRRFAAVGEIGLDYYWDTTFKLQQAQ